MLTIGLTVWSLAQAMAGLVTNFGMFIIARVALGVGESPQFTSAVRVVRDWHNVRERALPIGIVNTSPFIGQAIAPPLLTALMLTFGWRWMFVFMGMVGLVVAVIWFGVSREPRHIDLSAEEREHLTEGEPPAPPEPISFARWRELFGFRSMWGLMLGCFGIGYISWLYAAWLPGYLEIQRHMSIRSTGWIAAIPICPVDHRRGWWRLVGRLADGKGLLDGQQSQVATRHRGGRRRRVHDLRGGSHQQRHGRDLRYLAMISGSLCAGLFWALASVIAPANCTASAGSMANFGGYLGSALVPMVTGFIVQATGSFTPALLLGGAIGLMSSLCYLLLIRNEPIAFRAIGKQFVPVRPTA